MARKIEEAPATMPAPAPDVMWEVLTPEGEVFSTHRSAASVRPPVPVGYTFRMVAIVEPAPAPAPEAPIVAMDDLPRVPAEPAAEPASNVLTEAPVAEAEAEPSARKRR